MRIKPIDQIVSRWVAGVKGATAAYSYGVSNPDRDWADATSAASATWFSGVQAAHAGGRFDSGVRNAGTVKWRNRTLTKGVQMWPIAVAAAEGAYRVGFAPFREAIERLVLPQRFPKRDPRNLDRVAAIVRAMISTAEGIGGRLTPVPYQPIGPQPTGQW